MQYTSGRASLFPPTCEGPQQVRVQAGAAGLILHHPLIPGISSLTQDLNQSNTCSSTRTIVGGAARALAITPRCPHCPRGKCRLSSNIMALITSVCGEARTSNASSHESMHACSKPPNVLVHPPRTLIP